MARVLWVSMETPSREGQGGQRRQFHQINALRERGHDITVLIPASVQSDASIRTIVPVIRPRLHVLGRPSRRRRDRMHRTIRSPRWDAIVLSHHESAWLVPTHLRTPLLVDVHNVMSHWHGRAGRAEEAELSRAAEAHALELADAVMTCSELETRRLVEVHPAMAARAFSAPLGIDPAEWPDREFSRSEARVALFGTWSWHPNRLGLEWFVREVWPLVTARVPDARGLVAGTGVDDASAWPPGIDFVGRVADLAGFTASAAVAAVPVRDGVGASVKFAEALATGASVIATVDGANAFDDPPAFVSDDARAWADWIADRLDRRTVEPTPSAARAIALRRMTWDAAVAPIDAWLRGRPPGLPGASRYRRDVTARADAVHRTPAVSVIVCTTGASARMGALAHRLTAVLDAAASDEAVGFEALVVDNSPAGGLTMPDPRIRVVRCALPGLSRARTTACVQARGDVLVFTDDDVEFPASWPAAMAAPLLDGHLDAAAAPVRLGPEYDHLRSRLLREWLAEGNLGDEVRLIGAGMAVHRRVLGSALWDERIGAGRPDFAFGEETLFESMIRAAGARIGLVREAEAVHHPDPARAGHDDLIRVAWQKGLSDAYYAYHWLGEGMPLPRLRRWRRQLRLRAFRLRRRDRELRQEEEARLVESVGRAAGFVILDGEPRAYRPRPLPESLNPPARPAR